MEATEEEIRRRAEALLNPGDFKIIQAPPGTGVSWLKMTPEEQKALREYYDNTDFSHLMETEGVWEYPEKVIWPDEPEQLELDLGVVSKWDDEKPYSVGQISFYFDRVVTNHMWNEMVDVMGEAVTNKGWPEFMLCAIMNSGRDRDLFPEAYEDESKEPDRTEEKEM